MKILLKEVLNFMKFSRRILGCYDLFLAIGAIYNGIKMVSGSFWNGEFPDIWLGRVPFTSWLLPGVIAIVLYGVGNLIAAYFSFSKKSKGWILSGIMGIVFLVSLLISIVILGDMYLAIVIFIILALMQILITAIIGINDLTQRKNR